MGLAPGRNACLRPVAKGRADAGIPEKKEQDGDMSRHDFFPCAARSDSPEKPEVRELIEERNRFLSEHPQLKPLQGEIDRLLGTTLDPSLRLEILFMLISEKLGRMKALFGEVARLAQTSVPD